MGWDVEIRIDSMDEQRIDGVDRNCVSFNLSIGSAITSINLIPSILPSFVPLHTTITSSFHSLSFLPFPPKVIMLGPTR